MPRFPSGAQFLLGFNGGELDVSGVVEGPLYDNKRRVYQFDGDPALTDAEWAFNMAMPRFKQPRYVNRPKFLELERIPLIEGRLAIPVVSVHTLGDLFVPFSMQQIYAKDAKKKRRSRFLVSRATRALGHCEFSFEELVESFQTMVDWVDSGVRPQGRRGA